MATRNEEPQRYTAGEVGCNRVRLYPRARDGKLLLDYCDQNGKRQRKTLDGSDWERAKLEADTLAADLRRGVPQSGDDLTLQTLFDNYEREVTPTKGAQKQRHDRHARKLFVRCWGADAKVADLDRRDWDRFIQQRRSGKLAAEKGKTPRPVRDRIIEYDLRFLLSVCHWAEAVRVKGRPMLERNPFLKLPLPTEANPNRPTLTDAEFVKLREAARRHGADTELYVLLVHETGHRCSAVSKLRWSDINVADAQSATIRWRPEHDKIGMDHTVPIAPEAAEALQQARKRAARIGDCWVFPSPHDPEQPMPRVTLLNLWRRLERDAGLKRVRGRGWHSLRRKFATDLKHDTPLRDLCDLGGWRDHNTIVRCYMKPDEKTMRAALTRRTERRAVGQ